MWCKISIFAPRLYHTIMATVTAFIRTSSKKIDQANVRFRLRDGREIQFFHVSEFLVKPSDFDAKNQNIKARIVMDAKKKADFEKSISERKNLILKLYNAQSNKSILSSNWLDEAIRSEITVVKKETEKHPETLFEYIAKFIANAPNRRDKQTGRKLSYNNIQQYKATEKHLKMFAYRQSRKDYNFSEINKKFYDKFVDYLQSEIPELDDTGNQKVNKDGKPQFIKEKFTQNTVGKHIRVLKLMLNDGNIKDVDVAPFYVFNEEVDNIYLDEEELGKLKDVDLSKSPYLDRVRDWFLLLAWTGCRFSDLEKISKTDIKDGFITFRQQKTNTKVTIPLHPVVKEILEKYAYNMPEAISNQKFNDYIKEVGKQAKIDDSETITKTIGGVLTTNQMPKYELISSHTGRRSFCTNMYKRGLPTLMIMSISGHKTEKSFLKYIKVKQEEHALMMKKEWEKMYK